MRSPVNVALAGISGYGDLYLESLLHDPRADQIKLVGVVDPMPQRCRRLDELKERGVPLVPNVQSLFNRAQIDDVPIELMMIVTPIHLHAPHTCMSLARGTSVLCEKPLAGNMADAHKMVDALRAAQARNPKTFAAIGYQWSFSQAIGAMKADVMAGVLGRPKRLKTIVFFPRALSYFRRNDWVGRIHTADGAGVLDSPVNNATSHFLHNMFYVLGRTRQSSAMPRAVEAELYRANDIENYDTAAIRAVTEDGTEILFYTTHAVQERRGPVAHFEFEKAVVEFDGSNNGSFVARFHDGRSKSYGQPNLDRHEKIWQAVDAVRTGEPVACDVHAAMAHTSCVMAAQQSAAGIVDFPARLRRTVELEDEPMLAVEGLLEALVGCYEQGTLPSASKHDWAKAGRVIELDRAEAARSRAGPVAVHA